MPSVQIFVDDTFLLAGEYSLITFVFSDAVYDFTQSDIVMQSSSGAGSGALSEFTVLSASMYQAKFTPANGVEGWVAFEIPFGSYSVGGFDPGEDGSSSTVSIDTKVPAATIYVADANLDFREVATVTVTFSDVVTGFDWSDLVGPAGSFFSTTVSSDGRTYTAVYRPEDGLNYTQIPAKFSLPRGSYEDASGNLGDAAISNSFTVDTIDENLTIFPLSEILLTAGESLQIRVFFINPVLTFDPNDVIWPSELATLSSWTYEFEDSGPNAGLISSATAYLTPKANISSLQNHVMARGVASENFVIDTLPPVPSLISFSDSNLTIGESAVVTVKFSEPVTGFEITDIDVSQAAGSVSDFTRIDSITFQMTFTPAQNVGDSTNILSIVNHSYTDLPGNFGVGASSSNFTINTVPSDVIPPSPSISMDKLLVGSSGVVITVQFNELVQNFTQDDFTVIGVPGVITGFAQQADGLEYRVTFLPVPEWVSADNQFVVLAGGYTDLAGNQGLAGVSANFMVDAESPFGVSLPLIDSAISADEQLIVTLQFSEPVVGLDVNDFDTTEAAVQLSVLSDEGGGIYTAVFTPIAGSLQSANRIVISDVQYTDQAGNPGLGLVLPEFKVDTIAPTVELTLSDSILVSGQSLIMTIAFDEPVTGFDINDIDTAGAAGVLGDLMFDGAGTYWVEFTPTVNTTSDFNVIGLKSDYFDLAGNAGVGGVSASFAIDTEAPTLSIAISDVELVRGESQILTFTFSEMVDGFAAADVLLDGAVVSLTSFASGIDGKTFTAIYTPANGRIDPSSTFSVAASSYTDLSGNPGLGATSPIFSIDTSLLTIYGTTGNDTLVGGAGDERLCGVPAAGTALGKGTVDRLTGGGGADQFLLADQRGIFYNDGSNKSNGVKDYAWITDFSRSQGDKLVVGDGTYFFANTAIGKISGAGLYLDTNGSNGWDSKDELIALVSGVPAGSMSVNLDLIHF